MLKVLNPFGPKIAKLKLSKHLVNKINKEVDKIISNKLLANRLDYSEKLVGQVKQEISLPKSFNKRNLEKTKGRGRVMRAAHCIYIYIHVCNIYIYIYIYIYAC